MNNIKRAVPEQYHELTEIWEASVRATHHFLSEADIQFYKPLILTEYLKAVELYIYEEEKIRGFIGLSEDKIEMLFISPEHFGKGIGKKLINYVIQNTGVTLVDVNEANTGALGFYEALGFKIIGRSELDAMGKPLPILSLRRLE